MAGANRSGDLANPSRAIPVGSLAAQTVTTFIYISFPILFGAIATQKGLEYEDWLFTAEISWPHHMVVRIGIIMSSVGAGLPVLVNLQVGVCKTKHTHIMHNDVKYSTEWTHDVTSSRDCEL